MKMEVESLNTYVYCVRGNHESRPLSIPGMTTIYDEKVHGEVYYEAFYPHIRYFKDGGEYIINGLKTLVIGGAYSVDKYYRLANHFTWYADEQLTKDEMKKISEKIRGKSYACVLTHTCPIRWEPFDLFLKSVDQSTVEDNMEWWLQGVADEEIEWGHWYFGHFHANRDMVGNTVTMLFEEVRPFGEH